MPIGLVRYEHPPVEPYAVADQAWAVAGPYRSAVLQSAFVMPPVASLEQSQELPSWWEQPLAEEREQLKFARALNTLGRESVLVVFSCHAAFISCGCLIVTHGLPSASIRITT